MLNKIFFMSYLLHLIFRYAFPLVSFNNAYIHLIYNRLCNTDICIYNIHEFVPRTVIYFYCVQPNISHKTLINTISILIYE